MWGTSIGEREAERETETEREGKPVVFLGDIEARTKRELNDWLTRGLNKEEVEEWVEDNRAGAGYTERIIGELEKEERGEKR